MEHIIISKTLEEVEFVKKAAKKFAENPKLTTCSDEIPKKGDLFAVRWGLGDDCILIFKIGSEVRNYIQAIPKAKNPETERDYPITYKGKNLNDMTKENLIDALIETDKSLRKSQELVSNLQMGILRDAGL